MASENKKTPGPAAAPVGPPPTMQEYRKEQMRLREMIEKQKQLSARLVRSLSFPLTPPSSPLPVHVLTLLCPTGPPRGDHKPEGNRLPRLNARWQHYHRLRRLYKGRRRRREQEEGCPRGAEPRLHPFIHLLPAERRRRTFTHPPVFLHQTWTSPVTRWRRLTKFPRIKPPAPVPPPKPRAPAQPPETRRPPRRPCPAVGTRRKRRPTKASPTPCRGTPRREPHLAPCASDNRYVGNLGT